jgi:hypothetical protein
VKESFQIGKIGFFIFIVVIQMKLKKLKFPKISFPKFKVESLFSKKREKPSKPFIDDVKSIFRSYRGQMIWISVLSGFLLFLLNILI